jgi:RNA polymerase sigma-70 factor (ECF subfamily)
MAQTCDDDDDETLVRRFLEGDEVAFEAIVRRYAERVRRVAFVLLRDEGLADDVAQETFLQALRKLSSLRTASSVGSWLLRIAANRAKDQLRQRQRWVDDAMLEERPDPGPGGDLEAQRRELRKTLGALVVELPDRYRTPLMLKDVEGMTYAEIAQHLKIPMGTVQIRIHRARLRLREDLRKLGMAEGLQS